MKNETPEIHQESGCEEQHVKHEESSTIKTDDITISIIKEKDNHILSWVAPNKTKVDSYLIKLVDSINPSNGIIYIKYPSPGTTNCKYNLTDINKAILYNINVTSIVKGQSFIMSNTVNIYPSESMESQIAKDINQMITETDGDAYKPILYHSQCAELIADYDSDDELYKNFVIKNYK